MSDSLVRVSRRAEWGARWPMPGARRCRGTPQGGRCQPRSRQRRLHGHNYSPNLGRCRNPHRSTPRVDRRTDCRRSTSNRGASPAPHAFTALWWKTFLMSSGIATWLKVSGLRQEFLLMTMNFSLFPIIDGLNVMPSTVTPFLINPLPGTPFSFLVFGIYGYKEIDAAFNILISNLL